ncbi:MAG TPA: (d)CMP kinase, partial [Thermomicrobiales bacterium]|nr:(d)CMP kinase [Thermomicrobiales bacterium]
RERARRRHAQVVGTGSDASPDEVYQSVLQRDAYDSERKISPLQPAQDAVAIDSDALTIEQVVDAIVSEATRRFRQACPT